ncbi:molybdopterin-dependent oxidoreductase [Adlercreutzia mucosicola]|jgi:anaerobic dimethyl sulfoxide reductase subunit A|uniref:molybdopterin-dependent oxidoreductase n=1 Tax=Adlercreutzia mucosicola TaxID=580026 RepID=UPI000410D949|nr:molybdopterin-dependent oxidoreductase [Adlercreutzia mucosicola]MCI9494513.1 molybdopterin-dependent oxidoreductase [Adlercreutzia mucosicola]MCR2035098.1 molybdopterin-dependent oxidoreductase [Adlercreutzia mucosicola]
MATYLEKFKRASALNRRSFVRAGAAATVALAAGGSLVACSSSQEDDLAATGDNSASAETEGVWVTAACWHNCGGRCLNKALVKDGVVVRQKTDDTHEDSAEFPQQRGCVRGRSQRRQVYAEDRLKYPMKRKGWQPGGGEASNGAMRGKDTWERISWDEALDLVTGEMKRIKETYGNRAFFLDSWTMNGEYARVFGLFGGFINGWGTCSFGNYSLTPQNVGYSIAGGFETSNDRFDFENVETVFMLGVNPAWSSAGMGTNILRTAKDAGATFIGVDPVYNESYSVLDAEWVPILPGSDTAFLLGVVHSMLEQDDNGSLIDWDFLDKAVLGFDADHMPGGVDPKENFKDYVLGTYDGQPKDAAWAETHCKVPADRIRQLAVELGRDHKVAMLTSWGVARTNNSDNLPQLYMILGAMGGHMGKSGHMTSVACHVNFGNHGPSLVKAGGNGLEAIPNPENDYVNDVQAWDMVLGKPYNYTGQSNDGIEWLPCEMRQADIHMIFHGGGNRLQSRQGIIQGIEAHRKVDCVVAATTFFTNNAKYADIVLPVNTEWEREGGFLSGNREMIIMYRQVIDSMYESKDDQWIVTELGKRLGLDANVLYPFGRKQQLFNMAAGATVAKESGVSASGMANPFTDDGSLNADSDYEMLVTITQEDIDRWGVEGTPQEGRIPLAQLEEDGIYQIPRSKGDNYGFIAFEDFVKDPAANPRDTSESGKLEAYSQALADKVNGMGYVDNVKPIPTFMEPVDGYEATFADFAAGVKGEFPYQVVTMHYMGRSHTTFGNTGVLQEAFVSPVMISTQDAAAEGIKTGDTVMLTSRYGKTLRTAEVTGRIIPGCVGLMHGSWSDYDEETGIDRGGSDNILFGNATAGQGTTGFNTMIVSIEKVDEELVPDCDKPRRTVEV